MQPRPVSKALHERYVQSGAANPKTVQKWRGRVAAVVDHLGHGDVTPVPEHIGMNNADGTGIP